MDLYIGFDPGGEGKFGWAVCKYSDGKLELVQSGNALHAVHAVEKVSKYVTDTTHILGIGIDAPLYWVPNGNRQADTLVRNAIKRLGAPQPGGTVQAVNSLRGACVAQGAMVAELSHNAYPAAEVNEAHPKALLFMLGLAGSERKTTQITTDDLNQFVRSSESSVTSEHERDAILACISCVLPRYAQYKCRDLSREESKVMVPFDYQPHYWMPWFKL